VSGLAKLLVLAVFLLGGGAALLLDGGADPAAAPPPAPMKQIRIASADLAVGTFLDPTDAPFQPVADAAVEDGQVLEGERDVLGAVVIAPIRAGEPVTRAALLTPGQEGFLAAVLNPGMRAVSVAVDAVSGNAGLIYPGDRVDVLLTQRLDDPAADRDPALRWGTETILRDVRVIAVDQNLKSDLSQRDEAAVARTVTFEVSPAEAEAIAVARNLGALSLTLRSLIVEGADPAADGAPGPTWAGDVSAVLREATGRGPRPAQPSSDLPQRTSPAPETPARAVVVLRGSAVEERAP
jgi:pilus assembly protein CpaB